MRTVGIAGRGDCIDAERIRQTARSHLRALPGPQADWFDLAAVLRPDVHRQPGEQPHGPALARQAAAAASPANWSRNRSAPVRCRSSTTASASSSASTAKRSAAIRRSPTSSPPTWIGSANCGRGKRCDSKWSNAEEAEAAYRERQEQLREWMVQIGIRPD